MLIRHTAIEGHFGEENPTEILLWSQNQPYHAVRAEIDKIKMRAGTSKENLITEDKEVELENKLGKR